MNIGSFEERHDMTESDENLSLTDELDEQSMSGESDEQSMSGESDEQSMSGELDEQSMSGESDEQSIIMDVMFFDLFEEKFDVIENDEKLNASNVIEKFKEQLQDNKEGKLWENNNFDINHKFTIENYASFVTECTLLIMATINSNPRIVQALLDAGANISVECKGYTALGHAMFHDYEFGYNDGNDMLCIEAVKPLIREEIKLKGSEAVKPDELRNYEPDSRHEQWSEHWEECKKEVKGMQEKKIGDNVTLYDILIGKNNDKITSGALKKAQECKSEFPIYANDLERQLKSIIPKSEPRSATDELTVHKTTGCCTIS